MLSTTKLNIRIAAVQGAYGQRLATYATQVTPRALEQFLGHDPRSHLWKKLDNELEQIYKQLQRTTGPERLRAIQAYIKKRFSNQAIICGAFPSISIAVRQHLQFDEYTGSNDVAGAGILHLDLSKSNGRIVLDGLARVSGVIELVEEANQLDLTDDQRRALNDLLDQFSLPVVIFAPREEGRPLDMREMRQLFADFNFRQTSIKQIQAMACDSSDIYVEAARQLGLKSAIHGHGGVESKSASLGSKSTSLVVLTTLVRFVRGAAEGDRFTEAKANVDMEDEDRRLTPANLKSFVDRVDGFFNVIAKTMGSAAFKDTKNGVHLSGPGWNALGVIFHDLDATLNIQDLEPLAQKIGEIDWRRSAPFWESIMREKLVRGKSTITFVGGGYESRQSIRRMVHEHLGTWDRLQTALAAIGDDSAEEVEAAEAA